MLFYLFYGLAGKSIHPAPNYYTQWTTAIKDTHVGDLFDSLIPQTVTVKKTK